MARRIKIVIGNIIKHDQTGFIKGRFIGDNIRHLLDAIDNHEEDGKPELLFIADFKKAFDGISFKNPSNSFILGKPLYSG